MLLAVACGTDEPPVADTGSEPSPSESDAGVLVQPVPPELLSSMSPCVLDAPECPAGEKCNMLRGSQGWETLCVSTGSGMLDEPCTREREGLDDCGPGLFCTPLDVPVANPRPMECKQLCQANAECSGNDRCYRFSLAQAEVYGLCTRECVFLETVCGAGLHCIPVLDTADAPLGICSAYGPGQEDDECESANDCGKDLVCTRSPDGRCRPYCNDDNPCADPLKVCTPIGTVSFPGLGACVPAPI